MSSFTKKAIKQSFVSLLKRKPLNQITVKDIVEECGINRNSFYYHFQDIPTLIDELISEETERLIVDYSPLEPIETCLKTAVHVAVNNRDTILHVYRYMDKGAFEGYLWRICERIVSAYTRNEFIKTSIPEQDRDVIADMYKCECFGLLIKWLDSDMRNLNDDEINRFCHIHGSMLREFNRSFDTSKE